MVQKDAHKKGAIALFGAAFTYATFGLLIHEMAKMFGDVSQTAARFLVAAIIMLIYCLVKRRSLYLPVAARLRALSLGLLFATLIVLFTIAVTTTTLTNSVALLYAGSILSSLLVGKCFFKEKTTFSKVVAILLVAIGLAIYGQSLAALNMGMLAALAAGLLEGLGNGVRKSLGNYDRQVVLVHQFVIGLVALAGMVVLTHEQILREVSFWPIVATLIFGVLQICLGNLLLYGFKHFNVHLGSIILATELVFATVFGFLFLHEVPTAHEWMGGILIFGASIIAALNIRAPFLRKWRVKESATIE